MWQRCEPFFFHTWLIGISVFSYPGPPDIFAQRNDSNDRLNITQNENAHTFSIFSAEPYYSHLKSISRKLTWVISQAGLPSHWCTLHMHLLQVPIYVSLWFAISYWVRLLILTSEFMRTQCFLEWSLRVGNKKGLCRSWKRLTRSLCWT